MLYHSKFAGSGPVFCVHSMPGTYDDGMYVIVHVYNYCVLCRAQLLPHGKSCPRYDQLLKENTETDYYKHVNKDHEVSLYILNP